MDLTFQPKLHYAFRDEKEEKNMRRSYRASLKALQLNSRDIHVILNFIGLFKEEKKSKRNSKIMDSKFLSNP